MSFWTKIFPKSPWQIFNEAFCNLRTKPSRLLHLKHVDDDLPIGERFILICFHPLDGTYSIHKDLYLHFLGEVDSHIAEHDKTEEDCRQFFKRGYMPCPDFVPDFLRETPESEED